MTHLRVVTPSFTPNDQHNRRVQALTPEQQADLASAEKRVLKPAREAVADLADAIQRGRHDLLIAAERRLLAVGLCAKDHADFMEKEPAK